ncbi:MAG: phosphoribosylformylglycinamidine synthase subunit PurS [Candidatus Atabeyarchaeum deiterrae]|jgi:phosphoribosylformylglycinamidine synthase
MTLFTVEITIENKPAARDPEGETVLRDLVNKGGFDIVKSIRSAKLLRAKVEASSEEEAKRAIFKMVNELRIYNPVAHTYSITVKGV